ncbi:MAG: tetratricopeptide repeat protein [Pseudomonadales bacterium]
MDLALVRADGWREVKIYNELIRSGETEAMNLYYRGYGYQMAGRYQLAIDDYDACLAMDPANDFVRLFRARAEELLNTYPINQSMNE